MTTIAALATVVAALAVATHASAHQEDVARCRHVRPRYSATTRKSRLDTVDNGDDEDGDGDDDSAVDSPSDTCATATVAQTNAVSAARGIDDIDESDSEDEDDSYAWIDLYLMVLK